MAQLNKLQRDALQNSSLPDEVKESIESLLKEDVRAASPSDLIRVPTTEYRRNWLEGRIWSEGRADRYELGYDYGIDALDLSEKSFFEDVLEELAEKSFS